LPSELKDQRRLAAFLVAEDVGADLTIVSLVAARDLLAPQDGTMKQPECIAVWQAGQPRVFVPGVMMPSPAGGAKRGMAMPDIACGWVAVIAAAGDDPTHSTSSMG
jgi:hypothetical protein